MSAVFGTLDLRVCAVPGESFYDRRGGVACFANAHTGRGNLREAEGSDHGAVATARGGTGEQGSKEPGDPPCPTTKRSAHPRASSDNTHHATRFTSTRQFLS